MNHLIRSFALFALPLVAAAVPAQTVSAVDFPGGTLAEYVETLRAAGRARDHVVNIVMDDFAKLVHVPPVALVEVDLGAALDVVEDYDPDFQVSIKRHASRNAEDIFAVHVRPAPKRQPREVAAAPARDTRVEVVSLRELTLPMERLRDRPDLVIGADTVLSALQSGMRLASASDAEAGGAELSYHEASGLLFVRGTPRQVGVAQEVLGALSQHLRTSRMDALDVLDPAAPKPGQSADKADR